REVVRIDEPQFNHNGGKLAFRATDHYLYLSLGDGGNFNDIGDGHNPLKGNGQDKTNVLGKLLRIDPLDPALTQGSPDPISANGKYRIAHTNPFLAQPRAVHEIFVYGLRNPFRFSFDPTLDQLIIGDVGQNNIEEIDLGVSGSNYGWHLKEGTFLFNPDDGTITPDPNPDPRLVNPVAEYSHFDGIAVIGGFTYRGTLVPLLANRYIFGDLGGNAGSARLFYTYLGNGAIFEFQMGQHNPLLGSFLKGFGKNHGTAHATKKNQRSKRFDRLGHASVIDILPDSQSHYLKLCERTLSFAVSLREEGEVALLESPNGLGATAVSAYAKKCQE